MSILAIGVETTDGLDPSAGYGVLNGVARHQIKLNLIRENWDDALRLAGSLKLGVVQAASIMKTLRMDDRPDETGPSRCQTRPHRQDHE
jgi:TnpA family transposase